MPVPFWTLLFMFSVVSKTRFHLHHHTFQKSQEYAKCKYGGPLSWCLDKSRESLSEASQALMFCFGSASQENSCFIVDLVCLVSPSLRVFVFLYATRRELHLSQQRKWFYYFSFLVHLWEETKHMEARSSRLPKELFKFRLEDLRKCVSNRI